MSNKTNHWKLGLFVVFGTLAALATIAFFGARSMRKDVVTYVSYFDESVQGLDLGSPVKFRGVTIGTVSKIDVAPDQRHVEVSSEFGIEVLERLGLAEKQGRKTKIAMPQDLRTQLAYAGLTGVKFVLLDYFPPHQYPAPKLPFATPENYIPAAQSTLKNIEDSMMRTVARMPDLADEMTLILRNVNGILDEVDQKQLPSKAGAALDETNALLTDARAKLRNLDTERISNKTAGALDKLDKTVTRLDRILEKADSDRGLVASVQRATEAMGEAARNTHGLGPQVEDTLASVKEAAKSIRKLADTLERDPDMLLKGRSKAASR